MACEQNPAALAAYLDGERAGSEAAQMERHLRDCPQCAAQIAQHMHLRRSLAAARTRYVPDLEWKKRVLASMKTSRPPRPRWLVWIPVMSTAVLAGVLLAAVWMQQRAAREEAFREVADLHVADLASDHPVDVVSSDRHTVKPWFAGKIPFSFNLPEFTGTEFTLIGGRVAYLQQEPGAQLLVGLHQHRISVLIIRESSRFARAFPSSSAVRERASFNAATWRSGSLRFLVIGDADSAELRRLVQLLQQANP